RENLHPARGFTQRPRAAVGDEVEAPHVVLDARGLQLLLGLADAGDLRVGVHDAGDGVVVDVAHAGRDALDAGDALFLGLVGQHRAGDHVADGVHARHGRLVVPVHLDLPALVGFQADVLETQAVGVGPAPGGYQHAVALDVFEALGVHGNSPALPGAAGAGDLGAEVKGKALLLEDLQCFLADLFVEAGQDVVHVLQHRDLGAQAQPNGAELEADHAGADHHQVAGYLAVAERRGAVADQFAVHLDAAQLRGLAAGGDQDVFGAQLDVVLALHADSAGARECGRAFVARDFVFLEQAIDAAGAGVDTGVFVLVHGGQVQLDVADFHAETLEIVGRGVEALAAFQHRFAGDAAHAQA